MAPDHEGVPEALASLGRPTSRPSAGGLGTAFRLAVRGLRRDIPTSVTVAGILMLGVTAPAVFFSLLWGGGMRTLPVPEGHRVVRMEMHQPRTDGAVMATREDIGGLARATSLEGVAGFADRQLTLVVPGFGALQLRGAVMTPGALELVGVEPELGTIPPATATAGVLLGHDVWVDVFEADPSVLGRQATLSGQDAMITGVMPEAYGFPLRHSIWTVLAPDDRETRFELFGRLAPEATLERASEELTGRWRQRDHLRPSERTGGVVRVMGFTSGRGEGGELVLFLSLVIVDIALLIISAVNAANLLMVRGVERIGVLGVQAALGAGRLHIAAQLLFEALVLSAVGGIAGLHLTHLVVGYIQTTASENFGYYWMRMAVELPVVLFVAALVLGAAILAGLAPVRMVLRRDLHDVLKHGTAGSTGRERGWTRVVTTGQLALSCAALVAAGLASRSIGTATAFGRQLPADEIVVATIDFPIEPFSDESVRESVRREVIERFPEANIDGAVAVAWGAPGFREPYHRLRLPDVPGTGDRTTSTTVNAVGPEYFDLFDIAVVRGRSFTRTDVDGAPRVALVNTAWVSEHLPTNDPLGRAALLPAIDSVETFQIVGVVETLGLGLGAAATEARLYIPVLQAGPGSVMVLGRRPGAPEAMVPEFRKTLEEVDSRLAIRDPRTLAAAHAWMTRAQFTFSLLAAAGGYAGLLVSAVGLYALLAFRVRRRRRELGVRLAMGADGRRVAREVLGFSLRLVGPAAMVGLSLAWLLAPALSGILLGNEPRDPGTFTAVAVLFLSVGLGVSVRPALAASRVAPARALRTE